MTIIRGPVGDNMRRPIARTRTLCSLCDGVVDGYIALEFGIVWNAVGVSKTIGSGYCIVLLPCSDIPRDMDPMELEEIFDTA